MLGFLLLTLAFRSLLVPAIGAIGNLLTIAVALGSTVALFQWGWGQPLFGIGGPAPLEYIVAILIVGVVFGLSMDYHVFLVSRMHERWTQTGDNRRRRHRRGGRRRRGDRHGRRDHGLRVRLVRPRRGADHLGVREWGWRSPCSPTRSSCG